MSVSAYPAYRDSGVEWLGAVPRHWHVAPLKYVATFSGGGTPSREVPGFWNGDIPWVSPKDMKAETIHDTEERITDAGLAGGAATLIERSAVLMVVRSGILRHTIPVAINERPVALNQDMKAIRLDPRRCHPRFLMRLVQGMNTTFLNLWLKQGATVESIEHEYLASTEIPLPPMEEQSAIAAFLDRETGKIDALVAEQERLIALLKEKRQAVISQAVTKGLDPNAPMKDSGVAWLGAVPVHWDVRTISSLTTKITNGFVGPTRDVLTDEGVRYLQSLHIKRNKISFDVPYYVSEEWSQRHAKSILERGDVLVVQTGDIGQSAVVTESYVGCNCHALIILAPIRRVLAGDWLSWVLNSTYGVSTLLSIQTGALHPHLNCGDVKDVFVPLPPLPEQLAIAAHVDARMGEFDTLSAEAERAIALLKERRAALISAAVTGKIDVRGLVPAAGAAAA